MGAADLAVAGPVLAGALFLLWRSLVRRGGACHGCDGAACGRPPAAPLVRLGARAPGQRGRGGASSS